MATCGFHRMGFVRPIKLLIAQCHNERAFLGIIAQAAVIYRKIIEQTETRNNHRTRGALPRR
jgi:hypothetical protein